MRFFRLAVAVVLSELAGLAGSVFTASAIPVWYAGLIKPAFNPPSWIFGPVWTLLYALMGIAAFLVWDRGRTRPALRRMARAALVIFIMQLALNVAWSAIFFGAHSPAGAFADIVLLWFAILWTIIAFARISRPAAYLLVPYLLWVSFAAYLNYAIWMLN